MRARTLFPAISFRLRRAPPGRRPASPARPTPRPPAAHSTSPPSCARLDRHAARGPLLVRRRQVGLLPSSGAPGSDVVDLHRVDIASGRSELVPPAELGRVDAPDGSWSRDRKIKAFVRDGDLFVHESGHTTPAPADPHHRDRERTAGPRRWQADRLPARRRFLRRSTSRAASTRRSPSCASGKDPDKLRHGAGGFLAGQRAAAVRRCSPSARRARSELQAESRARRSTRSDPTAPPSVSRREAHDPARRPLALRRSSAGRPRARARGHGGPIPTGAPTAARPTRCRSSSPTRATSRRAQDPPEGRHRHARDVRRCCCSTSPAHPASRSTSRPCPASPTIRSRSCARRPRPPATARRRPRQLRAERRRLPRRRRQPGAGTAIGERCVWNERRRRASRCSSSRTTTRTAGSRSSTPPTRRAHAARIAQTDPAWLGWRFTDFGWMRDGRDALVPLGGDRLLAPLPAAARRERRAALTQRPVRGRPAASSRATARASSSRPTASSPGIVRGLSRATPRAAQLDAADARAAA